MTGSAIQTMIHAKRASTLVKKLQQQQPKVPQQLLKAQQQQNKVLQQL